MAYPVVASTGTYASGGTQVNPHPVPMPATVDAGDLLIIAFAMESGTAPAAPTGWTRHVISGAATNPVFHILLKDADGTEGGTTVDFETVSTSFACAQVYRITGWHGALADDVDLGTAASGTGNSPDPPSVAAGWGSAENLFICFYGTGNDDSDDAITPPTNYGNALYIETESSLNNPSIGSARRELTGDTDDPGTFSGLDSNEEWHTQTLVIRPEDVVATGGTSRWFR